MSRKQGNSRGWAAFDLKQRQKNGLEPQTEKDPFPPIVSPIKSLHPTVLRNNEVTRKPFSSVLRPSVEVASLTENRNEKNVLLDGNSSKKHILMEYPRSSMKKINDFYPWADDSLVEDIMAAVDNDITMASHLLNEMVSPSRSEENKETSISGINSSKNVSLSDHTEFAADVAEINSTIDKCLKENGKTAEENKETSISGINSSKNVSLSDHTEFAADVAELNSTIDKCLKENGKTEFSADVAQLNSTIEKCLKEDDIEWLNDNNLSGEKLSNDARNVNLATSSLESVPVEPEWEEDDDYLRLRKDALRMTRSASQHSKAATNAFERGDHYSAQQYSVKAREQWLAAESLNNRAAKEILSIRNSKNDVWKLDLHGLHASEAIRALQEHLEKIERTILSNHSVLPDSVKMENIGQPQASLRQRPTSLQVITGIGNHSRGQAALPTAVRSFLTENGYRFEEPRPGVVAVRPKFRHR